MIQLPLFVAGGVELALALATAVVVLVVSFVLAISLFEDGIL